MLIIVPTRSRPQNVAKVVEAWEKTGAFEDGAKLLFGIDMDDPEYDRYREAISGLAYARGLVYVVSIPIWLPLVPKLNYLTQWATEEGPPHFAIGFAGDDHLHRTTG